MFRRKGGQEDEPAEVYLSLRMQALEVTEATAGTPVADHPDILGAVIDIPSEGGTATVITMADGSTSMYTSRGGGTLGAGAHAPVRTASRHLLVTLQAMIDMLPSDERTDLPAPDLVQITLITPAGRRRANVPAAAFWGKEPSTVVELIAAIHDLITAIRHVGRGS